jgi:murein DD-endopeptidase MepM/ murein hydrolase activator NlpD
VLSWTEENGVVADSFRWPLDSWTSLQGFGQWNDYEGRKGHHLGEDMAAPIGTSVYASGNGIVRYNGIKGGYSRVVIIEHTLSDQSKVCTLYGHLRNSPTAPITLGQQVTKGQLVGYVADPVEYDYPGSPHVHFGVKRGGCELPDTQVYYIRKPDGTWTWTWSFLGYTRSTNLTQTQKTNYDINHAQMRQMWYDPEWFVTRPIEKNPVSATDGSPMFTKECHAGGHWDIQTYDGHAHWSTYVGGTVTNPWDPDCSAEYRPYLSQAGRYDVYAYFYADSHGSTQVPFTVCYSGGCEKILVDQYNSAPTWKEVRIGSWDFTAGEDAVVSITDATGEQYDGSKNLSAGTIRWMTLTSNTPPVAEAAVSASPSGPYL